MVSHQVVPVYAGKLFRLPEHIQRLQRSLDETRIDIQMPLNSWEKLLKDLIIRNPQHEQQAIYLQITRGYAAKRDHVFPASSSNLPFLPIVILCYQG